jgi:hypothetical protein
LRGNLFLTSLAKFGALENRQLLSLPHPLTWGSAYADHASRDWRTHLRVGVFIHSYLAQQVHSVTALSLFNCACGDTQVPQHFGLNVKQIVLRLCFLRMVGLAFRSGGLLLIARFFAADRKQSNEYDWQYSVHFKTPAFT